MVAPACLPLNSSNVCAYGTDEKKKNAEGIKAAPPALSEVASNLGLIFPGKDGKNAPVVPGANVSSVG